MSKLDELIAELCPDGVEYIRLKECTEMKRGTSATKSTLVAGNIPVVSGGKEPAFYCDSHNRDGETITVAGSGAGAGYVQYWNTPIYVNDAFSIKGNEKLHTRYVYHYLLNIQGQIYATKKGGGVPHVHISSIENFKIPIPPLSIQEEIVRILDKFTSLEAELEAELEARRRQYEYYRDELFSFGDNNEKFLKRIGDIADCYAGATPSTKRSEYWANGNIPWMSSGEVNKGKVYFTDKKITQLGFENSSTKLIPSNTVVVALAGQGKTRGMVALTKIELCTNQSLCSIKVKDLVKSEYLYYYLKTQYQTLRTISSGDGTRGGLNLKMINDFRIPIPPLEEQERIVAILDRFDALVNDISQGIPAEIEARRKQYEYYRDKLLTFKEVV